MQAGVACSAECESNFLPNHRTVQKPDPGHRLSIPFLPSPDARLQSASCQPAALPHRQPAGAGDKPRVVGKAAAPSAAEEDADDPEAEDSTLSPENQSQVPKSASGFTVLASQERLPESGVSANAAASGEDSTPTSEVKEAA